MRQHAEGSPRRLEYALPSEPGELATQFIRLYAAAADMTTHFGHDNQIDPRYRTVASVDWSTEAVLRYGLLFEKPDLTLLAVTRNKVVPYIHLSHPDHPTGTMGEELIVDWEGRAAVLSRFVDPMLGEDSMRYKRPATEDDLNQWSTEIALLEQELHPDFLDFHNPPPAAHPVQTIVVLGTSPTSNPTSFKMRVMAADFYAERYPDALLFFTGKGRGNVSEARQMKNVLGHRRIAERVELDEDAQSIKQNIEATLRRAGNSLTLFSPMLFIGSGYVARRVDGYIQGMVEDGLVADFPYFTYDGDVAEDSKPNVFNPETLARKHRHQAYERNRIRRDKLLLSSTTPSP